MKFKSKVIVFMVALSLVLSTFIVSVYAAAAKNIALNCKVEASSYFEGADSDESPKMAVDGDIETKWCATPADLPEDGDGYHWIILDLGAEKNIGKYVLQNASLSTRDLDKVEFNLVQFSLEASADKKTWKEVDSEDANEEVTYEKSFSAPVKARYLRLNCIVPTASGDQTVRLPEIEVYEFDPNATVAATIAPTKAPTNSPTIKPTTKATDTNKAATSPKASSTKKPTDGDSDKPNYTLYIGLGLAVIVVGGIVTYAIKKSKSKKA